MHGLAKTDVKEYIEKVLAYIKRLRSDGSPLTRDLLAPGLTPVTFITGYNHGIVLQNELTAQLAAKGISCIIPLHNIGIVNANIADI
jgi:hypothetical protein